MATNSDLTFRLFGKDVTASKAFKGIQGTAATTSSRLGGMGLAFAGIGTAAAVAGAAIAIDFGKQSVDAFIDAQAKSAAFDDAMGRFKGLSTYKGALDDLAQSLALKTKFDDDETKAAIATLARYNLTGKQLETLTPLVQDFAVATGKDLGTASTLTGKALLGNTKALKELGISYKPTGNKAKDFANITQLLRDKVGGFAEKEGKTAAGTSEILANQFGEVKEKIGSYLVPALTNLGQMIITKVIPAIQTAVSWLSEHLGPVIAAVGDWIMNVAWPALQNLADAFMKNVWPAIQQVAGMVAENLQPAIEALGTFWNDTLLPAIQAAWPLFQKVALIIGVVVAAIAIAVSWVVGKLAPILLWLESKILPAVIAVFDKTADYIIAVGTAAKTVWDKVSTWFGKVATFVGGLPGKIAAATSGMWDGIKTAFKDALNWVIRAWNNFRLQFPSFDFDWNGPLPGGETHVGGWTVDTPNLTPLAKGGIVRARPGGLLAQLGEGRYDEAVVPLDGRHRLGTVVNVHVAVNGDTDPAAAARKIGSLLEHGIATGSWRPSRLATR